MNRNVIERLLELAKTDDGEADDLVIPPPEMIAFHVNISRKLMQLKVEALASMAGVSVSTIERVERGEKVSDTVLDKIAVAFGEQPGYFTEPRRRIPRSEVSQRMHQFASTVTVRVDPLRTQRQVRLLASCQGFLVNRPRVGDEFDEPIRRLLEWLDLTSFVLTTTCAPDTEKECGRRELYISVLNAVSEMEKRGLSVLAGVMNDHAPDDDEFKTAVISITPKSIDPGAVKGRNVLVDPELSVAHRIRSRGP